MGNERMTSRNVVLLKLFSQTLGGHECGYVAPTVATRSSMQSAGSSDATLSRRFGLIAGLLLLVVFATSVLLATGPRRQHSMLKKGTMKTLLEGEGLPSVHHQTHNATARREFVKHLAAKHNTSASLRRLNAKLHYEATRRAVPHS